MYVLDTNTLIYFFKGQGHVSRHLLSKKSNDIYIPSLVVYEIRVGIGKTENSAKKSSQFEELLSACRVLDFGDKESQSSANIRVELEKKGQTIGPIDTLIAGTALANHLTLVTHNLKEFRRVSRLSLEDWYETRDS